MNQYLQKFINANFETPGKALDLGAGDFADVKDLQQIGWHCEGVDKDTGVDLENPYVSSMAPFDLVFSNYVLHKLNNKSQLLKTAFDNLAENGVLFLHTFDSSDKNSKSSLNEKWLRDSLALAGFKNIATSVFDFYDEEHKHWHRILQSTANK